VYLGLDIGTSSVKALVIDASQRIVARQSAALTVRRPRDGWSEQDPDNWIVAVEGALAELHAEAPDVLAAVRGWRTVAAMRFISR
jgi:xylulokinase